MKYIHFLALICMISFVPIIAAAQIDTTKAKKDSIAKMDSLAKITIDPYCKNYCRYHKTECGYGSDCNPYELLQAIS
jgi:hypothetical protein